MVSPAQRVDGRVDGVVLDARAPDERWPVESRWRAAVTVQGTLRAPEWVLKRVKAVPLSSRSERTLLAAVAEDNGRAVLEMASSPGEHHVAAAVIASLRLAEDHPERAIRFLEWLEDSPNDPSQLRFLRRYLPGLEVLVEVAPDLPMALPVSTTALALLKVELQRTTGAIVAAESSASSLPPGPVTAVALTALRVALGDLTGARAISDDRPVFDDLSGALGVWNAKALLAQGDHAAALDVANRVLDIRDISPTVVRPALEVRANAQRALGRDVDASLTEAELGIPTTASADTGTGGGALPAPPPGPLFGRTLTDALDDAWARVRRQPRHGASTAPHTTEQVDEILDEAVALIGQGQFDAAETLLLAQMDRAESAADAGAPLVDDFFVVLAGSFDRQGLPPEEVATLERLRAAHARLGTELPESVQHRLLEARAALDALR